MIGRASVIYFDIGQTLAQASITGTGANRRIVLSPLGGVLDSLSDLRDDDFPLGIISNTPEFATRDIMRNSLAQANLLDFFEPELLIYSSVVGLSKDSVQIFCFAADLAGIPHDRGKCVFVGESDDERRLAREAGFRVAATVGAAGNVALGVN
jgi:FMN phosphatase YigB (HAD superfamily)